MAGRVFIGIAHKPLDGYSRPLFPRQGLQSDSGASKIKKSISTKAIIPITWKKKLHGKKAQAAEVAKAKQLMKKELEWIRRMPKARGTKAKYRIDAFEATKNKAKSGKKEVDFNLEAKMQRLGGKILELKKVSKAFDDLTILNDFTYTFKKGERIGVVGPNGVGKSTFLNLIAGELQAESGKIIPGQTLSIGYYTQSGIRFKEEDKMIDIITRNCEADTLLPSAISIRFGNS